MTDFDSAIITFTTAIELEKPLHEIRPYQAELEEYGEKIRDRHEQEMKDLLMKKIQELEGSTDDDYERAMSII